MAVQRDLFIKKAKRIVSEGGSIGLFAEGNLTYNGATGTISPAIVKFIRALKIPIIIFISEGLYLSNPRWSVYSKKGWSTANIIKTISPEEYNNMSDDDLYELVNNAIQVNYVEQQEKNKASYNGKELAKGLHRFLFMDLKTNTPFTTYTEMNYLYSTSSDFNLEYLPSGLVRYNDQLVSLMELDYLTKVSYFNYLKDLDDRILYEDAVFVKETFKQRRKKVGKSRLILFKNKLKLVFNKEELILEFDDMLSFAIQGKNKLIIYYKEKTYLIELLSVSSPYKYLLTYQIFNILKKEDLTNVDINRTVQKLGF